MDPKLKEEIVALVKEEVAKCMDMDEASDQEAMDAEEMMAGNKKPESLKDLKKMKELASDKMRE